MDEPALVKLNYHTGELDNSLEQANDMATSNSFTDNEQQQAVEILSDEDVSSCSLDISDNSGSKEAVNNETDEDIKSQTTISTASTATTMRNCKINSTKIKLPTTTTHYQSNFIRSSAITTSSSRRRSSRRLKIGASSSRNSKRQVRFQPIPQAIDISAHSSLQSNDEVNENEESPASTPTGGPEVKGSYSFHRSATGKAIAHRSQYFVGKLKQHKAAAKPLVKRLHKNLSHMNFNKIKLKSFNNLAHSLHKSFLASHSTSASSRKSTFSPPQEAGSPSASHHNSTPKFKSVRKLEGSPPFENANQFGKQQVEIDSTSDNCHQEEDCGWGSDFDDQSVNSSSQSVVSSNQSVDSSNRSLITISGTDSNHSGSQDSGHSTQHSACSCTSHHDDQDHLHHHHGRCTRSPTESPMQSVSSASVTCESTEPQVVVVTKTIAIVGNQSRATSSEVSLSPKGKTATLSVSSGIGRTSSEASSESDEQADRKSRFLQNRMIINSKLESLFNNHSSSIGARKIPSPSKSAAAAAAEAANAVSVSISSSSTARENHEMSRKIIGTKNVDDSPIGKLTLQETHNSYKTKAISVNEATSVQQQRQQQVVDPETRLRLLEQQRQISLKLKQKPRRKTILMSARRTLDSNGATDQVTGVCSGGGGSGGMSCELDGRNGTSTSSCRNGMSSTSTNSTPTKQTNQNSLGSYQCNRESLIKQLSMVCLRQTPPRATAAASQGGNHHNQLLAGKNSGSVSGAYPLAATTSDPWTTSRQVSRRSSEQPEHRSPLYKSSLSTSNIATHSQLANIHHNVGRQPEMSLRQLVKTVIDDCEEPGKLSSLTRSILNRSDSLSSDLAADDGAPGSNSTSSSNSDLNQQQQQRQLDTCHQLAYQHEAAITEAIESPACVQQITIEPRHSNAYLLYHHQHHQYQQQQQQQQNQPHQSTPKRPLLHHDHQQQLVSGTGMWYTEMGVEPLVFGNKNTSHNSSSISSGKQHLAYLDNSRNFFTDDDN